MRYGEVIYKTPKNVKIQDIPTNENGKTPKMRLLLETL